MLEVSCLKAARKPGPKGTRPQEGILPLKIDDLKTLDTYKKALKVDGARISPGGKTRFWIYRDVELPTASGQKQKLPLLIALVDDTAIRPLYKGKAPVCRGVCHIQDGAVAFEAEQGQVPYDLLKNSVPQLLGKSVHHPSPVKPQVSSVRDVTMKVSTANLIQTSSQRAAPEGKAPEKVETRSAGPATIEGSTQIKTSSQPAGSTHASISTNIGRNEEKKCRQSLLVEASTSADFG